MALSKTTGGVAALVGVLTGVGTVVAALAEPETAACVQRVASVFGDHGAAIGTTLVGVVTASATLFAWISHPPTHPPDGGSS